MKPIEFKLLTIETIQFATLKTDLESSNFQTSNEIAFGCDAEHRILKNKVCFTISDEKSPFITLEVASFFEIKEDSWNGLISDNMLVVPQNILQHFTNITVGASRGIILARLEMEGKKRFVLPLINLTTIITTDLKINIQA